MAGVLSFDGVNDNVKSTSLAAALAALSNANAATILFLVKAPAAGAAFHALGYLLSGSGAGTVQFGASIDANEDILMDLSSSRTVAGTFADSVYMFVITKPAGSPVTCRLHWKIDAAGAWTHVNFSGTQAFATTATMLELAAWQGGDFWATHQGIFAGWGVNMNDTQVEECDNSWQTSTLYNHSAGTPVSLIELNTTTPVDIGSGGASSLTVTGATVDAGQTLDGWNFNGTGGGSPQTIALGRASEVDTARALGVGRGVPLGRASETDTARALTVVSGNIVALGRASEVDTARPLAAVTTQLVPLGRASETDTARTLTASLAGSAVLLNLRRRVRSRVMGLP